MLIKLSGHVGHLIFAMDYVFVQVDSALAPGYAEDPLVEGFRVTLKRSDLATLSNLNWLNDEVYTFCAAAIAFVVIVLYFWSNPMLLTFSPSIFALTRDGSRTPGYQQ